MAAGVEGKVNKVTGSKRSLSPQFLINNFGDSVQHFKKVDKFLKETGLPNENDCPFIGRKVKHHQKVQKSDMVKVVSSACEEVGSKRIKDEDILKLLDDGPVVAALESTAALSLLGKYEIYAPPPQVGNVRHCVLIVDHGVDQDGRTYWLCRDSLGKLQGDQGYIRVEKNKD
ncbi:unnamed protein product [Cuscuta campestris]|uniref:Peptidase C1A papain C-terminal domain-containing protein n=1 Tax=Cuscuta campestris TaxID=132261 RepID=A0A484NSV8_9ASTE|nr:unnamed protein product [Cuscuta campestris]